VKAPILKVVGQIADYGVKIMQRYTPRAGNIGLSAILCLFYGLRLKS
jgi:hypothetical protein